MTSKGPKSDFDSDFYYNNLFQEHHQLGTRTVVALMDSSVEALDIRLRRLEYALTGSTSSSSDNVEKPDSSQGGSIPSQISSLNDRLTRIANLNKSIKRLLQACTTLEIRFT